MSGNSLITCSFCGDDSDKVEIMVKGKDEAAICSRCIALCVGILSEALSRRSRTFHLQPPPDPTQSRTGKEAA